MLVRIRGDHNIFKHPQRTAHIVVPHPKKDLGKGLVRSIYRDAGWPL
jgi:predicted RNA binding protein YcfA (HicA-like mRNA interferase family)